MSRRARMIVLLLSAAAVVAAWLAASLGSQSGSLLFEPGWPRQLLSSGTSLDHTILLELRLPRVLAALLAGSSLAVAGLVLQGVTGNALADPFLLGVSGGAALAVVLVQALPAPILGQVGWWLIPAAGFAGAQAASLLVLALARSGAGRRTSLALILAGLVINAFCVALMNLVLAHFDPFRVRVSVSWLAGDYGSSTWPQLALAAALFVPGSIFLRLQAHRLNAFALGEAGAGYVGVDVNRLLGRSALLASLLTGLAVSFFGLLGWVGLIVPHAVRLLVGRDFRDSLPTAAAAGALLLTLCDSCARLSGLLTARELPVGVLTALLGCPLLLWLLRSHLRRPA